MIGRAPQPGSRSAHPAAGGARARASAVRDGRPLPRSTLMGPLLRQHGADLLEQHIVLRCAQQRARERGIAVTKADVRDEFDRALDSLADPLEGLQGAGVGS